MSAVVRQCSVPNTNQSYGLKLEALYSMNCKDTNARICCPCKLFTGDVPKESLDCSILRHCCRAISEPNLGDCECVILPAADREPFRQSTQQFIKVWRWALRFAHVSRNGDEVRLPTFRE